MQQPGSELFSAAPNTSCVLCCFFPMLAAQDGLEAALAACSFKKELILLVSTDNVLDNALQLYSSLLKLGLAHTLLLVPTKDTCTKALAIFPDLCCVWSSLKLPEVGTTVAHHIYSGCCKLCIVHHCNRPARPRGTTPLCLSSSQAYFHFHQQLWHHRRRTTARAVRLGYNVMVLVSIGIGS